MGPSCCVAAETKLCPFETTPMRFHGRCPGTARAFSFGQMLSLPFYIPAELPITQEAVAKPLAVFVNMASAAHVGNGSSADFLAFSLFVVAVVWLCLVLSLAVFVTTAYARYRFLSSLPVKVCDWGLPLLLLLGPDFVGRTVSLLFNLFAGDPAPLTPAGNGAMAWPPLVCTPVPYCVDERSRVRAARHGAHPRCGLCARGGHAVDRRFGLRRSCQPASCSCRCCSPFAASSPATGTCGCRRPSSVSVRRTLCSWRWRRRC